VPTPGSTTDGNRQPDPVAAADITKAATSPGRSAVPATHISWDLSNPLHRLRRPDQTRVKTKCGRRAPLDRIDDSAPTCADCTEAMRAAAVELLASIRDPRFERGCLQDAARILSWWADARVPDDPRIAPEVRDEVAALLGEWAAHSTKRGLRP
jgi:hypothetical protein